MTTRFSRTAQTLIAVGAILFAAACGDSGDPTDPGDPGDPGGSSLTADAGVGSDTARIATDHAYALDGTGSTAPDGGTLTYEWEIVSGPSGHAAAFDATDAPEPEFTPDVPGPYTIGLNVSDGDDTASDTAYVHAYDPQLTSVDADTFLYALNVPYTTSGNVQLRAETTFEPGAAVEFAQGSRLAVETDGSLIAVGTESDTIRFVGQQATAGFWDGIEIVSNKPGNELTYTEVAHGGSGGWSNIYVQSAGQVKVTESRLHTGTGHGMYVESEGVISGFSSNEFHDNQPTALRIPPEEMASLDGASSYVGSNADDYITVSGGTITTAETWPKTDAPFYVAGNVHVEAADTVEAGARFLFAQDYRLSIESGGSLTAIGAESDTIRFTGEQNTAGYWDGIEIVSNDPANIFTYTEIAHGGSGGWSNIWVQSNGQVKVTESRLHTSSLHGMYVESAGVISGFSSNEFHDNAPTALRIPPEEIASLDGASTYVGNNAKDYITVRSGTVTSAETWPKTDAPFYIAGNVHVEAADTVEAGARFRFAQNMRLSVESTGSLTAAGTSSEVIEFTGEQATVGFWDGIEIVSNSPSNVFDHTEVAHGGADSWANFYLQSTSQATVTNSHIHHSATYGIEVESGASLTESGNTYNDNASGGVSP